MALSLNANVEAFGVTQALNELSDFIKYAHPRMKDHQKLLRNLMILEMVVRVLEQFDPKAQHARYVQPSVLFLQ